MASNSATERTFSLYYLGSKEDEHPITSVPFGYLGKKKANVRCNQTNIRLPTFEKQRGRTSNCLDSSLINILSNLIREKANNGAKERTLDLRYSRNKDDVHPIHFVSFLNFK